LDAYYESVIKKGQQAAEQIDKKDDAEEGSSEKDPKNGSSRFKTMRKLKNTKSNAEKEKELASYRKRSTDLEQSLVIINDQHAAMESEIEKQKAFVIRMNDKLQKL